MTVIQTSRTLKYIGDDIAHRERLNAELTAQYEDAQLEVPATLLEDLRRAAEQRARLGHQRDDNEKVLAGLRRRQDFETSVSQLRLHHDEGKRALHLMASELSRSVPSDAELDALRELKAQGIRGAKSSLAESEGRVIAFILAAHEFNVLRTFLLQTTGDPVFEKSYDPVAELTKRWEAQDEARGFILARTRGAKPTGAPPPWMPLLDRSRETYRQISRLEKDM